MTIIRNELSESVHIRDRAPVSKNDR